MASSSTDGRRNAAEASQPASSAVPQLRTGHYRSLLSSYVRYYLCFYAQPNRFPSHRRSTLSSFPPHLPSSPKQVMPPFRLLSPSGETHQDIQNPRTLCDEKTEAVIKMSLDKAWALYLHDPMTSSQITPRYLNYGLSLSVSLSAHPKPIFICLCHGSVNEV